MEQNFSGIKYRNFGYIPHEVVVTFRKIGTTGKYHSIRLFCNSYSSPVYPTSVHRSKKKILVWKGFVFKSVAVYGKIPFPSVIYNFFETSSRNGRRSDANANISDQVPGSELLNTHDHYAVDFRENSVIIF